MRRAHTKFTIHDRVYYFNYSYKYQSHTLTSFDIYDEHAGDIQNYGEFTLNQLAHTFPEAKVYMKKKLKECKLGIKKLVDLRSFGLLELSKMPFEMQSKIQKWLFDYVDKKINRLKGNIEYYTKFVKLTTVVKSKSKNGVNHDQIYKANNVPIPDFYDIKPGKPIRCPFHDDKTASMHYFLKNNKVHCFGCDTNYSAINLIMKLKNIAFVDAVRYLIHE